MMVIPPRYLLVSDFWDERKHFDNSIKEKTDREDGQIPFRSLHFVERVLLIDGDGVKNHQNQGETQVVEILI